MTGEDDSQYLLWPEKTGVEQDKEWKIKFNQSVDGQTVHTESIFIKDANLAPVSSRVWLDQDGLTVHAGPRPGVNYQSGAKYYLYITSKVHSLAGNSSSAVWLCCLLWD